MSIPDRQKQRREYLKKKVKASGRTLGYQAWWMVTLIATGLSVLLSCLSFVASSVFGNGVPLYVPLLLAVFAFVMGYQCRQYYRFAEEAAQEAAAIPYVPPITSETLPAEEVLVRGSQEPTQEQSTVLLRAAGESADSPGELLRASTEER